MVTVGDGVGATTIGNLETLIVTVVPFSVTASAAGFCEMYAVSLESYLTIQKDWQSICLIVGNRKRIADDKTDAKYRLRLSTNV